MGRDDWYRSTTWNPEIKRLFEQRLQRSRTDFHKAQYLRIQGLYLMNSDDFRTQQAGVALTERLIQEYPNQKSEVVHAHEILGDYFFKTGLFEEAELHFRIVLEAYKETRSNTTGLCDLSLVELILKAAQSDKYIEAVSLLESTRPHLLFNSDVFRFSVASARLLTRLDKSEEAASYARKALQLANIREPQFPRHPTVGLVKATKDVLSEMHFIAGDPKLVM
jgi:tetratricopeptide (TPR) repeat protein